MQNLDLNLYMYIDIHMCLWVCTYGPLKQKMEKKEWKKWAQCSSQEKHTNKIHVLSKQNLGGILKEEEAHQEEVREDQGGYRKHMNENTVQFCICLKMIDIIKAFPLYANFKNYK